MEKKKSLSKDELGNLCRSCLLFKKYYEFDFWFGSLYEYENIKYCRKYTEKYICYWIHSFLLEGFNSSFVILIYKRPCFIKFVESGIFEYLDHDFLESFHGNYFTSDPDSDLEGKGNIANFVISYFQKKLKKRFEEYLFFLISEALSEVLALTTLNHLSRHLKKRLKAVNLNKKLIEKGFIISFIKPLYQPNRDIENLIESFDSLITSDSRREKKIGPYKKFNVCFLETLLEDEYPSKKVSKKHSKKHSKKVSKYSKAFNKSFNTCYAKYKHKRKFESFNLP